MFLHKLQAMPGVDASRLPSFRLQFKSNSKRYSAMMQEGQTANTDAVYNALYLLSFKRNARHRLGQIEKIW